MPTLKDLGELATLRLRQSGLSEEEIGRKLGSATEQQISQFAGILPDRETKTFNPLDQSTWNLAGVDASGMSASFPLTDLVSQAKTTEEARREAVETGLNATKALIARDFNQAVSNVRQQMEQELSGTTAIGGRRAGLGASTTLKANLELVKRTADQRIDDLERQKADAVSRADMASAARIDASLAREQDQINALYKDAWDRNMDIYNIQNQQIQTQLAQTQMDWSIISKLGKDETWTSPTTGQTYTGIAEPDPFFTSSNIVSLMTSIPIGQSQEIQDPNTGETWTITGIGKPDINTQIIQSEDPNGNVTLTTIDKTTGEIIKQVSAGRIGKGFKPESGDKEVELFKTDLEREIDNLVKGNYGKTGGREKIISILQAKARFSYPSLVDEIPKMIYGTEGYEPILGDDYSSIIGKGGSLDEFENY
uniref:Uncharacterized protein n=1 Tax=viral metagenome TaxID=1070528 RepID=A0A6H1ZFT2_9ZZZZ